MQPSGRLTPHEFPVELRVCLEVQIGIRTVPGFVMRLSAGCVESTGAGCRLSWSWKVQSLASRREFPDFLWIVWEFP